MEQLKYVDRRNTNCSKWDNLQAQSLSLIISIQHSLTNIKLHVHKLE